VRLEPRVARLAIGACVCALLAGTWLGVHAWSSPPRAHAKDERAAPAASATTIGAPYDVIVVGAGLAGLTAAKQLLGEGRSVVVLEATDRIGGRALTNKTTFSIPIDYGGAWFHGVDTNPLPAIADRMGFHREHTILEGSIFVGARAATAKELGAFARTTRELEEAMTKAAASLRDPPASEWLPKTAPFRDLVAANLGPFESAAELEESSTIDTALFATGKDDFVREGIGSFVEAYGRDVPVRLRSPVTRIEYGADLVSVDVATGERFAGRTALVTVSTGVLASGKIAFEPPLPQWKKDAIAGLPMGLLDKVVIEFKKDVFGKTPPNSWVLHDGPGKDDLAFVVKPMGAPIAVAFYGAKQAAEFEREGDAAAIAHAREALALMYGPGIDAEFLKADATAWGKASWALGSYSAARPGMSRMHAELARPVGSVLFFAGEACAKPIYNGSLAGAYDSAITAANEIAARLAPKAN
jgi:monoamine oxidase